jgi:GNAT superfamily N-acetyltransferase
MTLPPEHPPWASVDGQSRHRGLLPFADFKPPTLALRPATPSDLAFLEALYASTRAEEMALTGWPAEQCRAFLAQQFKAQHGYYHEHYEDAHYLVVCQGDTPIGRLYWYERDAARINLMDVAFLPPWRGQGLGTALLRGLSTWADLHGQLIELHVEPGNPARRLYQRLGFTAQDNNGVYLRMHRAAQPAGAPSTRQEAANA